jgi:hypothetical protein
MSDTQTIPVIPAAPPWVLEPGTHWIKVGRFAHEWNKNRSTIRQWCESGYFCSLGISTYRDHRGVWFIRVS